MCKNCAPFYKKKIMQKLTTGYQIFNNKILSIYTIILKKFNNLISGCLAWCECGRYESMQQQQQVPAEDLVFKVVVVVYKYSKWMNEEQMFLSSNSNLSNQKKPSGNFSR